MSVGNSAAIIGPSVKLRGELAGTEDLEFHGEIQGSISLTGARVTIGVNGKVTGNIAAKDVIILGKVDGNIRAEERADLRASAVIAGEIFAPRLQVEPGADLQVVVSYSASEEEPEETAPKADAAAESPNLITTKQGASEADAGSANSQPKAAAGPKK